MTSLELSPSPNLVTKSNWSTYNKKQNAKIDLHKYSNIDEYFTIVCALLNMLNKSIIYWYSPIHEYLNKNSNPWTLVVNTKATLVYSLQEWVMNSM